MNPIRSILAGVFVIAVVTNSGRADEFAIKLKATPGVEAVQNNCAACHSLDYVLMNSSFMDARTWTAEVTKMISAFGAPINEADAKTITDYLAANYGG
jgi:mono/diheme cytochrome c family protein